MSNIEDVAGVLRLHVDDAGCVWYGDADHLAVNTYLDSVDFVATGDLEALLRGNRHVRMFGSSGNASLLVHLYSWYLETGARIQLVSPAILASAQRKDAETSLHYLWQPSYTSRLCGSWHDMTPHDYIPYAMIDAWGEDFEHPPELVQRMACYHPAWPALTFVSSLNADLACRLLCTVIDPRWYRHPTRPHRLTRLYGYLGLTLANARAFLGQGFPSRYYDRAVIAMRTWYPGNRDSSGVSFLDCLLRRYSDLSLGLLRSTQKLVQLFQSRWLQVVQMYNVETGFDARRFFASSQEAMAYDTHCDNWRPAAE